MSSRPAVGASRGAMHPHQRQSSRVLVIGAGPAGLAAWVSLRDLGIGATVVDRTGKVGGSLRSDVPPDSAGLTS